MQRQSTTLSITFLLEEVQKVLELSPEVIDQIKRMGTFIAVFYAPKFLTAEKPDIAGKQVKIH